MHVHHIPEHDHHHPAPLTHGNSVIRNVVAPYGINRTVSNPAPCGMATGLSGGLPAEFRTKVQFGSLTPLPCIETGTDSRVQGFSGTEFASWMVK
jgi:hypothetical protein